jgi:hypothetical protein
VPTFIFTPSGERFARFAGERFAGDFRPLVAVLVVPVGPLPFVRL